MSAGQGSGKTQRSPVQDAGILLDHATDLKDEAYRSGDASLLQAAVAEFDKLHRQYGGSATDSSLAEILAIGSYNRAGALMSLGRTEEARSAFASLSERYAEHADPGLREVGLFARLRLALAISVPEPPDYILNVVEEMSEGSAGPEGTGSSIRLKRGSAILASHQRAREILDRFRIGALPFVLFLRSFELEAYEFLTDGDWTAETGLEPHTISMSLTGPSSVERQLVAAFPEPPVVLSVANRVSLFESAWSAPRLFLPDQGWMDLLLVLIRAAAVTVVQIGTMSPGVRWELEMIQAHGALYRTLIVCGREDDYSLAMMSGLRRFAGLPAVDRSPVHPDDPTLSHFPHAVRWEDVPPEGITAVPPLPELFAQVQSFRELEPERRLRLLLELESETS